MNEIFYGFFLLLSLQNQYAHYTYSTSQFRLAAFQELTVLDHAGVDKSPCASHCAGLRGLGLEHGSCSQGSHCLV